MSNEPKKRSEWWMSPEDSANVAAGHREMVAIQSLNLPVTPLPEKKRDWIKEAEQLRYTRPHAWEQLYADSLEIVDPELFEDLNNSGEFEAFVKVKVSEALDSYQLYLHNDMDPQTAKELALSELMGMEKEDEEDMEDDEDMKPVDWEDDEEDKPKRMALQVGTTINKNGQQYRLNDNHRWTRVEQGGQSSAPQTAQPQRPQQRPQQQQPKLQQPANASPKPQVASPKPQIASPKAPSASPQQASPSVFQGQHNPRVESDPNHDGVTDRARVGVPAFDVPPPPRKIPRIPGLSGRAKRCEEAFASKLEQEADDLTDRAIILFTGMVDSGPATFETDACKKLSDYWQSASLEQDLERRSANRATLNTALHQTANAICKRAFVKHLDTLPEGSEILVTVGGCGAGKGYALKNVPQALELKNRAAVVWDSAGDQNACENPWILQEARKRGLKVNYVFVHADPKTQWADPGRGVVKRAQDPNDGRMVDAMVFADSYAIGAKNHHAFAEKHKNDADVKCVYLMNGAQPKLLDTMPPEALNVDRRELAKFAVDYVNSTPSIPEHIRQGALGGTKIWQD
mgnify:CR=1 FL=1